jgi:hypothetical protein
MRLLGDSLRRAIWNGNRGPSPIFDEEIGPVCEQVRIAHDSEWLRAMSIAMGSHCEGSARQAWNALCSAGPVTRACHHQAAAWEHFAILFGCSHFDAYR